MAVEFNDLLRKVDLSPVDVRLLRHHTTPGKDGITLFDLWQNDRDGFELYQRVQERGRPLFRTGRYWASFVSPAPRTTVFVGIYEANYEDTRCVEWLCPYRGGEVGEGQAVDLFTTTLRPELAEYIGTLQIEWDPRSIRRWNRYASRASFPIVGWPEATNSKATNRDPPGGRRLSAKLLGRVNAEHIWNAVERLLSGTETHAFGPSTDFDLVVDERTRLPPKAVFGLAASEALGFPVQPRDFTGGSDTFSFKALRAAGFLIVPKGSRGPPQEMFASVEDREWAEGNPKLVLHLKRERAAGLSQAKKQSFIAKHGQLFCERCEFDPIRVYGDVAGEACIEVHHHRALVGDMDAEHRTRLDDLQCLCANCHRVVHALLKRQ